MSMDARQIESLNGLGTDTLPRLAEALVMLMGEAELERKPSSTLAELVALVVEQLNCLNQWLSPQSAPNSSALTSAATMSDEDAMAKLAQMDAPVAAPGPMSNDEAQRILAEMDAPAPSSPNAVAGPMSNDEAQRILAEMDAPAPTGVAASQQLPATTDVTAAPPASQQAADNSPPSAEEPEIPEWRPSEFQSDQAMLSEFILTGGELMENLDQLVLELEKNPTHKETIESIFRFAHTLKGTAAMFGFAAIERVMHRMENLFDLIRKDKLIPNSETIDAVFQGLDVLRTLLDAVKAGKPCGIKTSPIVQALTLVAQGKKSSLAARGAATDSKDAEPAAVHDTHAPNAAEGGDGGGTKKEPPAAAKKAEASTIRVDLERLDALVNLVGELVIDRTRFATLDEELRTKQPQLKLTNNLTETVQLFGRHMNDVQEIIMKVRMVPIGNAFSKFPRVIRDLARQLNKEMELIIKGETTELDKTLVEMIADPLVHLVRNACDHGIENPDIRQSSGKSKVGRITLSAAQEGNHILITIEDDGKGMDPQKIRAKAIEKGLISENVQLSDTEILNLIFEPGFSTAEKVTTVSGRGVGMDVVKKQIAKLKGSVILSSKPGFGSKVAIQIPLTLAIVQSLLVQVKEETFAIPQSTIVESIRIQPKDIQRIGDNEVINLRNKVLPLIYIDRLLGLESRKNDYWYDIKLISKDEGTRSDHRQTKRGERMFVVVVGSGEKRFGLVVDQLLNQQEMVIKSMGRMVAKPPCIAGGAVLGNGEVVLALDVGEIEDVIRNRGRHQSAA